MLPDQSSLNVTDINIDTEDQNNTSKLNEYPRIIQLTGLSRVSAALNVLGDKMFECLLFTVCATLIWTIAFSNVNFQGNRLLVAFFYSIGGDLALHLLVTSLTSTILSIRLQHGIRLDSLCDYLTIIVGPQPKLSITKASRFFTMFALLFMNHAAEQAVNYGVPSQPSLNPRSFYPVQNFTLAPLGGGVLLTGDPFREDGKPRFKFFATGLSILATDPDVDNTAFYTQDHDKLIMYHLPHEMFQIRYDNIVTKEFNTLGYVGTLKDQQPSRLKHCATTSSVALQFECNGTIPEGGIQFTYEVTTVNNLGDDSKRTDIRYRVASQNADKDVFDKSWAYEIDLRRSLVTVKCQKKDGKITCKARDTGTVIEGKNWLNPVEHENDIAINMASCFVNLMSFNTRSGRLTKVELAGRLIVAMHVRHASDSSLTGGLATSQVKDFNLSYEIADAIFSYRGPFWLRFVLTSVTILALLSVISQMFTSVPVPSTLMSIISSLGEVTHEHRAACEPETQRALKGHHEVYNSKLRVFAGVAAGDDRYLECKRGIRLTKDAGPGDHPFDMTSDLAHFSISTWEKIVPFSMLGKDELASMVFGHIPWSSRRESMKKFR